MRNEGIKATRGRQGLVGALLAALIFLVTLNLRPAITTVGPVLDQIGETFRMGEGLLGVLGALPLFMFAMVSPVTSRFANWVGVERALCWALIAIAAGIASRSLLGAPGLWVGTALATGAIAVGNVLVPVVVRHDYRNHVALATGVYSATMGLGAATASALAAPLAARWNWQVSLLLWAIPAIIVAALWLSRAIPGRPVRVQHEVRNVPSVWRSGAAWWLTVFMGLQSAAFYFMVTWLPSYILEHGGSAQAAGMTLFWYQIAGISAGFIAPLLLRGSNEVRATLGATIPILLGLVGLLLFPEHHRAWSIVVGVGSGISLVVSLSLISMRGKDAAHTARLSGMVQSVGYLIAALAPLFAGMIAQMSGSLSNAFLMMILVASTQLVVAVYTGRGGRDASKRPDRQRFL